MEGQGELGDKAHPEQPLSRRLREGRPALLPAALAKKQRRHQSMERLCGFVEQVTLTSAALGDPKPHSGRPKKMGKLQVS